MEITLEKIELVKDRTGVTYKEAKEALEASDGSVVDAIIDIEENIDNGEKKNIGQQGTAVIAAITEAVKKGNVSKIVVKNKDGEVLINIPVNAGIIGAVVAPWGVVAGMIASFGFKCIVEIVKDDGTIVDVSDRVNEGISKGIEKGSEIAEVVKTKSSEMYDNVKNGEAGDRAADFKDRAADFAADAREKAADIAADAKDKFNSKAGDAADDISEQAEDFADDLKDKVDDIAEDAKEKVDDAVDKAKDAADDLKDKFDK